MPKIPAEELSVVITAITAQLAKKLDTDEVEFLSDFFNLMGNALAFIASARESCGALPG